MVWRVILGLLLALAGFVFVWKTEWFQQNVGGIAWAEEKMGTFGGSRMMYKLIGILLIIVGFLAITNLHEKAFIGAFGWMLGIKKPL